MSEIQVQSVRRKIGDRKKVTRELATGSGQDRSFHLSHQGIFEMVVMINNTEKVLDQDYTLDSESGRVLFIDPPLADTRISFDYAYAAYSDEELEGLIVSEGGVTAAAVACIEELLADTARMYDFTQGETSEKKSQIFSNLSKLRDAYMLDLQNGSGSGSEGKSSGLTIGKRTVGPSDRRPLTGHNHLYQSPSRRI